MKKFNLTLLLIFGAIPFNFAQSSQNYDMSVEGEKRFLNLQLKGLEILQKKETEGKLVSYFMEKSCQPEPNKETIYLGPFNTSLISGKQDYYTCYHFDGMKHKILGIPRYLSPKYITDFFNKGEHEIKILGYSKPKYMAEFVASYVLAGLSESDKTKMKYENIRVNNESTTQNGKRSNPDIYYWVIDVFYLPRNEFEIEKKRLYDIGIQEAQSFKIQNLEEARYYNYYYGKDNVNNYQYNENIISSGYSIMKNIEEKLAFLNLYNYSNYAKTMQKEILKSNDFDILLYAFRAIRTNDVANEMEKKIANLAIELYQIRTFIETFPNSVYLSQLDDHAYKLCSVNTRKPDSYLSLFPAGKHVSEANETIEKIKEEIRINEERIRQKRIEKIANEGSNGVYERDSYKTYGLLWGGYTVYNVEFNDSTTGAFYKKEDGRYCLETGLFGSEAVYYATEDDASNALYVFRKTNSFTSQGRTGDSYSEFIVNQNRADVMPVPNYIIKGWKYNGLIMETEVTIDGESIGTICHNTKSNDYYIWGLLLNTYYDSEANIVRALYAEKKNGVLSTIGKK